MFLRICEVPGTLLVAGDLPLWSDNTPGIHSEQEVTRRLLPIPLCHQSHAWWPILNMHSISLEKRMEKGSRKQG